MVFLLNINTNSYEEFIKTPKNIGTFWNFNKNLPTFQIPKMIPTK